MKSFLLCEKVEMLIGLRLAGISGKIIHTKAETEQEINLLLQDKDIGLIIVSETLFNKARDFIMDKKLSNTKKLIIQAPAPESVRDKDYIMKYITNSIGVKV